MKQKPVIGIIGGIGSGKSEVARLLAEKGGRVIAGDQLGHEGLAQPEIQAQVAAHWGDRILGEDGKVSRPALGRIVFADETERKALEAILFPYIGSRIAEEIQEAGADADVSMIILDAAVMLEAGWDKYCDSIVFVKVPREKRIARLKNSRGWDESQLAAREAAQVSLSEKKSRADHVIDNSRDLAHLREQIEVLKEELF